MNPTGKKMKEAQVGKKKKKTNYDVPSPGEELREAAPAHGTEAKESVLAPMPV